MRLVMWRALVSKCDATGALRFARGFAFHQHLNTVREHRNFTILTRHDVAEFINGAREVGDFFFKLFHGVGIRWQGEAVKRRGVLIAAWPMRR